MLCALAGAGIILFVFCFDRFKPAGDMVRTWDFAPLSDLQHPEFGWAAKPTLNNYVAFIQCGAPGERTWTALNHRTSGPVEVWVASRNQRAPTFDLAILFNGQTIGLQFEPERTRREFRAAWYPFRTDQDLPAGDLTLALIAHRDVSAQAPAEAGDVYVVRDARTRQRLATIQNQQRWHYARGLGIACLVAAMFLLTRLRKRPASLALLAFAAGMVVEIYLPTARWGYTDDDWHVLSDQSGLVMNQWRSLLINHQGHVFVLYRALFHLCYLAVTTHGWLMRGVNLAAMGLTVWVMWRLMWRWTRSGLAASAAAGCYLLNTRIYAEQLWGTAAHTATLCVLMAAIAMFALDRYLRKNRVFWLVVSALAALASPLFYGAGIIIFPIAAIQWIVLYPRLMLDRRRLMTAALFFVSALAAFFVIFKSGIVTTEASASGLSPITSLGEARTVAIDTANMVRKALLWGLQSHDKELALEDLTTGGVILVILVLLPIISPGRRRLVRVLVAGMAMALLAYAVIFGIRRTEDVTKSHYQVMGFIGLSIAIAASFAALCRVKFGKPMFALLCLFGFTYGGWQAMSDASPADVGWGYLFGRQERLTRIMAHLTAGEKGFTEAPFLSNYRVCHMTPGTPLTVSQLAAIVNRQFIDELKYRAASVPDDFANPEVRSIYRGLARESFDELMPVSQPGLVAVAIPGGDLPLHDFFALEADMPRDADKPLDAMGLLELPIVGTISNRDDPQPNIGGIIRLQGMWYTRLAPATLLRLYTPTAGQLRMAVGLRTGSMRGKGAVRVVGPDGTTANWDAPAIMGERTTTLPLHAGINDIWLMVEEADPAQGVTTSEVFCFGVKCRIERDRVGR